MILSTHNYTNYNQKLHSYYVRMYDTDLMQRCTHKQVLSANSCELKGYPTCVRVLSLASISVATCMLEWLLCRGLLPDLYCSPSLLYSNAHAYVHAQEHSMLIDSIYDMINRCVIAEEAYKQVCMLVSLSLLRTLLKLQHNYEYAKTLIGI